MKVVALNGSPHQNGNTALAIQTVFAPLQEAGIETEILEIGSHPVQGCMGCGRCFKDGHCVFADERFTQYVEKIYAADGILLASPVYYGSMTGSMKSFLDRFFYQNRRKTVMRYKVGASLAVMRRSGGPATIDAMNRYIIGTEMLLVPSCAPNMAFGSLPGEILQDAEGMDALSKLGRNMRWVLQAKAGNGTEPPAYEKRVFMNFIRKENA